MQDPVNLAIVRCDRCDRNLDPKEFCVTFTVSCLWNGAIRKGFICKDCAIGMDFMAQLFNPLRKE